MERKGRQIVASPKVSRYDSRAVALIKVHRMAPDCYLYAKVGRAPREIDEPNLS